MSYARITTLNSEWDYLKRIEERWETLDAELISAPSEAQVELLWNDFQKFLEFNGIRAIEERMPQRFTNHLKRYQDAGYYTDIG